MHHFRYAPFGLILILARVVEPGSKLLEVMGLTNSALCSGSRRAESFQRDHDNTFGDVTYYLNIEVINADSGLYSQRGFLGDFSLRGGGSAFSAGSDRLLRSTTGWLAFYNDTNFAYASWAGSSRLEARL